VGGLASVFAGLTAPKQRFYHHLFLADPEGLENGVKIMGFAKDKQLLVPYRQRNMDEKAESPKGWFTDEQREKILRNIGTSLIVIQLVEHLIDTALLYVFRESPPTLEEIEQNSSPKYRARTLGKLLEVLREEASIDPNFDERFLKPYLTMRNEFVHRLTIGEGKSFKTNSGKLNALNKAFAIFTASGPIIEAIGGPLRQWLEKKGVDVEVRADVRRTIEQLSPDGPYAQAFGQVITPVPQKDISNRIQGLGKKVEIFSEEVRAVLLA
jgi:hypothetical protein